MTRFFAAFLGLALFLASVAAQAAPPLWRLQDEDTTIHLFGTVHVLKPGTQWLSEELDTAISNADTLYLEVSAAEQQNVAATMAIVQKYGMIQDPNETLSDHLPAAEAAALTEALASVGIPAATAARFKPWFAGITYSTMRFMGLGYDPASGVEAALVAMAAEEGVPAEGLETMDFQMRMFDAMSDEDVVIFIRDLLEDDGELGSMMGEVTTAWTQGDLSALDEQMNDLADASESLAELLIYSRNRNWAEEIGDMMGEPGDIVIAVGSGHFVGEQSVIQLLRNEGFTVERVQ